MTASARLDLRMNAQDKDKITHAADLRGIPVATFVRLAALREAETVAVETNTVVPSAAKAGQRLSTGLIGRATTRLSTDEIMQLTRGA